MTTRHTGTEQITYAPFSETSDAVVRWWPVPTGTYRGDDLALLDDEEADRAAAMRSAVARAGFITCRAAVKRALSEVLGVPADGVSLGREACPGCGNEDHGPPVVRFPATAWRISVAHTDGLGMVALSPFRVGVDVEHVRPLDADRFDSVVLTPVERRAVYARPEGAARTLAFLRCWTRKEAVLKAVGIGIATDLTALDTGAGGLAPDTAQDIGTARDLAPAQPAHTAQDFAPGQIVDTAPLGFPALWRTVGLAVPDGWVASLALPAGAAGGPYSVRRLGA
ncbi:4'-phosphopantetheinyl transferase superfamily protein [Streptomyces sp. NPDC048383]|uniref:4'-phosphopantetheinyl transferase family protein n=1 Tax=Streptomyces sp. NPDC048383 TaxID=3155386 RepID=UPI00341FBF68